MDEVLSYAALKAERDALEQRVNALAVENVTLREIAMDLADESAQTMGEYDLLAAKINDCSATDAALAAIEARVWAEAKDLAKSMLATDSADHIDFLFDGKIKQLREGK